MDIPLSGVLSVKSREDETTSRETLISKLPTGAGIFDVTGDQVFSVFLNDGYYQMIGCSREDRRAYDQDNVLQAIKAEDVPGLLQEARDSIREGRLFRYRFRVLDGQGEYRWTSIKANHEPLNEQTERFYASYADIDELIQMQQHLRESEMVLRETMKYSGTSHFLYYPQQHRYEAVAVPEQYHLPKVMENYPESMILAAKMPQEDAVLYRAMMHKIDGGALEAECIVRISILGRYNWYRVHFSNIFDRQGQPVKAIGSAVSAEGFRIAEANYRSEKLRMNTLQSGLLSVTCVNVTGDRGIETNDQFHGEAAVLQDAAVLAEAIAAEPQIAIQNEETRNILLLSAEQIPDSAQRRTFLRMCSHAGLMRLVESGIQEKTLEYRRRVGDRAIWVSTRIAIRNDPETGDALAFFYTTDIHERMLYRRITSQIMDRTFDSVAYVDLGRKVVGMRESGNDMKRLFREQPYEQAIDEAMVKYVVPEQRAAVKAQYDLDNIRAQLEHSSVYTILYTSFWKEDRLSGSPQIRMKSEIRYLDESRDMLVILQSDITEVYEQQRQQQKQEAEAARSREQTRMLERIVHRIPAGLAVYSRQDGVTTVVIVNEYLARLAGMPESRILNHNLDEMIRDRIHPEDFETVSDGMRRLFADGSASFTYRTQTMTGEYRWITAAGQTEQEADGSERAYVLYTDASEEKKQEEEYDARIRELSAVNPNAIGIFHLNLTENKLVRLQSQMADALHLSEEDTADSFIDKCIAGMAYETDSAYCRSLYSREAAGRF